MGSEEVVGPKELRARIERVYQTLEKEDKTRGALSWFARQARVTPVSVSRWLTDGQEHRPPLPTAVALLECMEKLAELQWIIGGGGGGGG